MVIIEGDRGLRLRELSPSDKRPLARLANNKKIWDNLRDYIPYPYTTRDAEVFIALCREEDPKVTLAIEYRKKLAGVIGLVLQKDVYRISAELGYWIGEKYWSKGIGTRSIRLMLHYGFSTINLHRVYAGVFGYNVASCRVLEKNGFVREGILREAIIKNDRIADELRYGCLKRDFEQLTSNPLFNPPLVKQDND